MHSAEDLDRVAADAHELQAESRRLAARLALLPIAAEPDVWNDIKPQVCDGLNIDTLDDLRLGRVLESAEPPSFGHAKRWDAARTWFIEKRTNTIRSEAEALILAFASRIRDISSDTIAPILVLASLQARSHEREVSILHRGLCEVVVTALGYRAIQTLL